MSELLRHFWRAWKYRLGSNRAEIKKMLAYLRPGDLAVDIGAHKGAYTHWMARAVGLSGKVEAFEPQPSLASLLSERLPRLFIVNTTVHCMALSDHIGSEVLHIPRRGGGTPSATLEQGVYCTEFENLKVPVTTLDEVILNHPFRPLRFVKCDAEGHELEIFRGARKVLSEDGPALLFECEARHHSKEKMNAVFKLLHEIGYQGQFFYRGELFPVDEFRLDRHQAEGEYPRANNFFFQRC